MSNDHQRLNELFNKAVKLPESERNAFLAEACGVDTDLRRNVEAMLAHDPGVTQTMAATHPDSGPPEPGVPKSAGPSVFSPGDTVDKYTIIRRVAPKFGAMGEVYEATETGLDEERRVALKVPSSSKKDDPRTLEMFTAEKQTLSRMQHPGIPKVYNVGTTEDGIPYLAMEFIEGEHLLDHCNRTCMTIPKRLELFAMICDIMRHAHLKLEAHSDLKPANILVCEEHGEPRPMVIDFGVSKPSQDPSASGRDDMPNGGTLGFTHVYASPEQLSGQGTETASDIYSLGVILYELLVGKRPFNEARLQQEFKELVATAEPITPSTRVTQLTPQEKSDIARDRGTPLAGLASTLRSELEWIPLKALRKKPEDRYESASAFGKDIRRYLNHEPLEAGPESQLYRQRKWLRRHRIAVGATCAIFTILIVATGVSLWLAEEASIARNDTAQALEKEEQSRIQAEEERVEAEEQRNAAENLYYNANMSLANWAHNNSNRDAKKKALESCRGFFSHMDTAKEAMPFEWRYLIHTNYAFNETHRVTVTKSAGTSPLSSLAYNPGGTLMAAAGNGLSDGTIRICDASTLEELHTLDIPETNVGTDDHPVDFAWASVVAFTPRSGTLVSGSSDGTIHFWDLEELEPTRTFSKDTPETPPTIADRLEGLFENLADTPIAWNGRTTSINDVRKSIDRRVGSSRTRVDTIAFSADEGTMISAHRDGGIIKWNLNTGEQTALGQYRTAVLSPDGDRMVTQNSAGQVTLWETNNWSRLNPAVIETGDLRSKIGLMAFSPTGESFLVRMKNGLTRFSTHDGSQLEHYPLGIPVSRTAEALVFTRSGDAVFLVGKDDLHRFNLTTKQTVAMGTGQRPTRIALNPDNDSLATVSSNGDISLLLRHHEDPQLAFGPGREVSSLALSPDGSMMAVAEAGAGPMGSILTLVSTSETRPRGFLKGHDKLRWLSSVTFSPDGRLVAASNGFKSVMWDTQRGELLRTFNDGRAEKNGTPLLLQPKHGPISFSPNGHWLAAGVGTDVQIFDIHTGLIVAELEGHTKDIRSLVFHADGSRLATGSNDTTIRIWDTRSGRCLHQLKKHESNVSALASSPDGRTLGSADSSGMVRLWNWATGEMNPQPAYASLYRMPDARSTSDDSADEEWMMTALEFHPVEPRVVSLYNNTVAVWDSESGNEITRLAPPKGITKAYQLAFSQDGNRLFVGGQGPERAAIHTFETQPRPNRPRSMRFGWFQPDDPMVFAEVEASQEAYLARVPKLQPRVDTWFADARDEQMKLLDEDVLALLDNDLKEHTPEDQQILRNLVLGRFVAGRHTDQIPHHQYLRDKYRNELGEFDRKTLRQTSILARKDWLSGNTSSAIEILEASLSDQWTHLGESHELTRWSIEELQTYHERMHETQPAQGHDARASEYRALHSELYVAHYENLREKQRKELGDTDEKTLHSTCNIAWGHWLTGNKRLAIEILEESLPIQKEVLGQDHSLTAYTVKTISFYRKSTPSPYTGHESRVKKLRDELDRHEHRSSVESEDSDTGEPAQIGGTRDDA